MLEDKDGFAGIKGQDEIITWESWPFEVYQFTQT